MTSAPNYNDGRWHGWNGGECPVHPETVVDALFGDGGKQPEIKGDCLDWSGPDKLPSSHVAAFRVVKEHREPREWFVFVKEGFVVGHTVSRGDPDLEVVKVREVLA